MKKVLFLDSVHPILMEMLQANGFVCEQDYTSSYSEIKSMLSDYFGIVIRSRIPMDKTLMEANTQLGFIARSGAGLENIDLITAKELGIEVINSPEGNMDAVGEHVIGMLLMLFNKLGSANIEVKKGQWQREENRGLELAGKKVGILGFGKMGSALAKKLQGFDCTILAYDKYRTDYAPPYVSEVSLHELQAKSDIISIHLPLSAETRFYVDIDFIDACEKPFFLVNTARGNNVNTDALVAGLEKGKVRGACLDVLEYEKKSLQGLAFDELPPPFKALTQMENVVLSPHVAGWTVESYLKLSQYLGEKIISQFTT